MHHSATGGLHSPLTQMSSADTSIASLDPSFAEPRGRSLWRLVAPFAVAVALLSALLTFVVLKGLTRIQRTSVVVISILMSNDDVILLLVTCIVRIEWSR